MTGKEEKAIMKAIRRAEKSKLLTFDEGTKEFEKLHKRLLRRSKNAELTDDIIDQAVQKARTEIHARSKRK